MKRSVYEAALGYVRAYSARRDAHRMLDIGFDAATEEGRRILSKAGRNLEEAIEIVAAKEAVDRLDIYEKDPASCPDGRFGDTAFNTALVAARKRYHRGKCSLCRGPALPCARRHGRGLSCA
jgi:hypothetical protein